MAIHNIKGMRVPSVYRNIGILPIHHPDKYHQNLRRVTSQTADRDDMKKKKKPYWRFRYHLYKLGDQERGDC